MKNKSILKALGLILLIFITITTYRQIATKDHLFVSKDVTEIKNWTYMGKTITNNKINLQANESFTVETNFPLKAHKYLLLRSSLSHLQLSVDQEVIYKANFEYAGLFKTPLASLWHLVELPSNGENIKITYQSPFKKMNGLINPVIYGDRGDLLFHLFDIYGGPFIIDGLILFFGILMIILSLINTQKLNNSIFQVGLFAILVAFWLISESKMLQFFSGSQWVLGSLPYISLALMPIPLLSYIKGFVSDESKSSLNFFMKICISNLIIILLLQVFGIKYFFETLWITHSLLIIFVLITLKQLYFEIKVKKNKLAKNFLISLAILFLFGIIDLYRFYTLNGSNFTLFVRLGLLIFILLLGLETSKQIVTMFKKSYKAKFYEELAYLDQLTQGPNRTAFETDLNEIFKDKSALSTLRLVILDMNQLKKINDDFGHVTGDEAIKTSYNLIYKHFNHLGRTYRIGGDEFACIIKDDNADKFNECYHLFNESIITINETISYQIGIALGSVTYDPSLDTAVKKMMHRADTNMYQAKKEYKALFA